MIPTSKYYTISVYICLYVSYDTTTIFLQPRIYNLNKVDIFK